MNTCQNCAHSNPGNYCDNCGQKFNLHSFTFKHIFEEAFHAFTHADKSFLGFVQKVAINPGKLAYEYIVERKRKRYFNPFTFFLLILAINAFFENMELSIKEKLFHDNNEYGHLFNVYNKFLFLLVIPAFAFFIWVVHHTKSKIKYSEYTVLAMVVVSAYNLIEILVHVVNYSMTAILQKRVSLESHIIYLGLGILYIAYADFSFHQFTERSFLKSLVVAVMFFAVIITLQIFIIYAINNFQRIGNFVLYGIEFSHRPIHKPA